jgi:two-component system nitrate/nitrite response regulator NarL
MPSQSRGPGSGPILVVDDDEGFRSFVTTTLSYAGLAAREAATASDALAYASADPPTLIVLDVCLPGIGGFEVCRQLRDQFGDDLPIIFVSGMRMEPADRAAGLLIGSDDYLVKPVDPSELLARVRRHLARSERKDRDAVAADFGLTKRELTILKRAALGMSQHEIATEFSISPRTVVNHLQHVIAKLGVHSRAEAVALAYAKGLVEAETGWSQRSSWDFGSGLAERRSSTSE